VQAIIRFFCLLSLFHFSTLLSVTIESDSQIHQPTKAIQIQGHSIKQIILSQPVDESIRLMINQGINQLTTQGSANQSANRWLHNQYNQSLSHTTLEQTTNYININHSNKTKQRTNQSNAATD
jgi:hypothetical protein